MSFDPNPFKYDKRTNIYNAQPAALRKFRASLAKAEAGTGLCDIVMCGTSISAGSGSTRTTSWPEYVKALLVNRGYPIGGTGIMAAAGNPADPRVTLGSGWSAFTVSGSTLALCTTAAATITFVADSAGTFVDVYVWNGGSPGNIAWTIDGVAQTAIVVGANNAIFKTTVAGLSNVVHTVVLTCSGTGTTYVLGVDVHGTSGVKVTNLGLGGATSSNISTTGQAFSPLQVAKVVLPGGLCFIEYGANETSFSGWQANLVTGITNLMPVSDVVLIPYAARSGDVSTDPTISPGSSALAGSVGMRALSDIYGIPVVDIFDRFGPYSSWGTAQALAFDSVHPNAAGARDMARAVASLFSA